MRFLYAIFAMACALLAMGCDRQGRPIQEFGLDRLEKGISGEADVRQVMGQPATVRDLPDGGRRLEFPRGPAGHRTWFFDLGPDGKLKDYRQVLSHENFQNIVPGLTREQVRDLLGRPLSVVPFPRMGEEVWDWRYLDQMQRPSLFNVHFDAASGKVKRVSESPDPHFGGD